MEQLTMGSKYSYKCNNCRYEAEISGGKDYGMVAVVRTMLCQDCVELVDVLIGAYGKEGKTDDPELDKSLNRCPECNKTNVMYWDGSNPCPKCDGKMIKGQEVLLWD